VTRGGGEGRVPEGWRRGSLGFRTGMVRNDVGIDGRKVQTVREYDEGEIRYSMEIGRRWGCVDVVSGVVHIS
jgi:hypothetical protein